MLCVLADKSLACILAAEEPAASGGPDSAGFSVGREGGTLGQSGIMASFLRRDGLFNMPTSLLAVFLYSKLEKYPLFLLDRTHVLLLA